MAGKVNVIALKHAGLTVDEEVLVRDERLWDFDGWL